MSGYHVGNLLRVLIGDEAKGELPHHLAGNDGLGPGVGESALDTVQGQGGETPTSHEELFLGFVEKLCVGIGKVRSERGKGGG